jgi:hypothetical protein
MLVDIKTTLEDDRMRTILTAIGGGDPDATRLAQGLYQITHFSFDHICPGIIENYPELDNVDGFFNAYGVCDSPDQFMTVFGLALTESPRRFCVAFTEICKADQSPHGGWRWHKWGPYIGKQEPMTEYLADEPQIERVFTYHVYEVK